MTQDNVQIVQRIWDIYTRGLEQEDNGALASKVRAEPDSEANALMITTGGPQSQEHPLHGASEKRCEPPTLAAIHGQLRSSQHFTLNSPSRRTHYQIIR